MEKESMLGVSEAVEQILIDFGDICRFCLSETSNNISIHDTCLYEDGKGRNESTIVDFVTRITSIKIENVDGFPSLVCEKCFNVIKMCFEFGQSCRQSDCSLRDCYEKTLEEAKAKYSLASKKEEEGNYSGNDTKNFFINHSIEANSAGVEFNEIPDDFKDSVSSNDQFAIIKKNDEDENDSDYENMSLKPTSPDKKQSLGKVDSVSVVKAGTIKHKYQRISSLSERLKEAQSKLVEDILRTNDIMSTSVKFNESSTTANNDILRYSCPQCQTNFVSSEMLTYHFLTSHIEKKNQRVANFRFKCKMCVKEFLFMYQLMRHYKVSHKIPVSKLSADFLAPKNKETDYDSGNKYECLDCDPPKGFTKRANFMRHLTQHGVLEDKMKPATENEKTAPGKLYSCTRDDCDQTFSTKFSLNRHLMNIHKLEKSEITEQGHDSESSSKNQTDITKSDDAKIEMKLTMNATKFGLKLTKIYLCVDCSPPSSFSEFARFIQHKSDLHGKTLENISLKELTPIYVESANIFEKECDGNNMTFKVICKTCEVPSEFYSASDFVQHMKVNHENMPKEKWNVETMILLDSLPSPKKRDRIWKCTECPASYIRKHSLHYHLKEKHNKILRIGGIQCPEANCEASFITNRQVVQHGITAHKKYFANIHKVFKDKILQNPTETDERVRNFECDICQKKYLGKTSLKRHILKTHLGKAETENAICSYCGKTFSNNLNLKSHIDFVHEALFVSCPICKKNINFKTIGKHYKIHRANTDFEPPSSNGFLCNLCGRVLKSKSGFDDHQKLHLNVRDQICDICGNGFTTKKNLYIHKKAHDEKQKKFFQCDLCDKSFTGKHTLNRHLLTHSGQKNFVCEICSKSFYTLQELNRHVRYHKKEYRFDCQMCDMRFLDRSRFRHHMMRHRNIRPHKCHFCDKVFIVRRKMNLHMAARHNVEVQNTKAVWKDPKTYIPLDDLL